MHIRALVPEDAMVFHAFRLRGLKESPEAFASSYEEEVGTPIEEIERRLGPKADSVILGAFQGSELRAVAGLQRESMAKLAHKSFIWGLYVAPEVQGQGVGTQIMRHALSHAATVFGSRQVNIGVSTLNAPAIKLYKRLGFVEYGLERGCLLVGGVLQDEYQMVLHVTSAS